MIYGYLIVNLILLGGLLFWFHQRNRSSFLDPYFWPSLIWKVLNGLFYGVIFIKIFQEGDTRYLFEDARIMAQWALEEPVNYLAYGWSGFADNNLGLHYLGQPRALLFSWLITPLVILGGGNYWITALQLTVLSFTGFWILAVKLARTYPGTGYTAGWCLLFLPSAVFWSSGVSKEALFMAGWCWLIAGSWPALQTEKITNIWKLAAYIVLAVFLFKLKYYYMAVTIPLIISTIISWSRARNGIQFLPWALSLTVLIAIASFTHPNLQWSNLFSVIQQNSELMAAKSHTAVLVEYRPHHDPAIWSLINAPKAWLAGMFRPFLTDWGNSWQNLAVLESLIMWSLALAAFFRLYSWLPRWRQWLPVASFIIFIALLLALSTPNLGTLVRLKVIYQPICFYLLLSNSPWWDKITVYLTK